MKSTRTVRYKHDLTHGRVADRSVYRRDVKPRRYTSVLQCDRAVGDGVGTIRLECDKPGVVPDKTSYRRIRLSDVRYVQIGEVVGSRITVRIQSGIEYLVASVAVQEHSRILRAVVQLRKPHLLHLCAEVNAGRVGNLYRVCSRRRSGGERNGSLCRVCRPSVGEFLRIHLHAVHGHKPGFRELKYRCLPVGGVLHSSLAGKLVDLLKLRAAAVGESGNEDQRDIPFNLAVCRSIPFPVFLSVQNVGVFREAEDPDGLRRIHIADLFLLPLAVVQLPQLPVARSENIFRSVHNALPQSGNFRIGGSGDRANALHFPDMPLVLCLAGNKLPYLERRFPPVVSGIL